jgi:uridylate kinase
MVLSQDLKVADATAISLCRDNKLPIVVFDLMAPGNIRRAAAAEQVGTLIA